MRICFFVNIFLFCMFLCGCTKTESGQKPPRIVCRSSELCKYSETPFPKDKISEIEIHYWVTVRAPGYYENYYDDGIRERIVIIKNRQKISKLLKHFQVGGLKHKSTKSQINIVFKSNSRKWQGELIDKNSDNLNTQSYFLMDSNEEFELINKFFIVTCESLSIIAENNFRKTKNANIQYLHKYISLNKQNAQKKSSSIYNENCDDSPNKEPIITYIFE